MNKGYQAVDGDFSTHTGHTSSSFDDFLSAIGDVSPSESYKPEVKDDLNTDSNGLDDFDTDAFDSFMSEVEDYEENEDQDSFDKDFEDAFEDALEESTESTDEEDEDEEDEDEETEEAEEYDFHMEDWDSKIVLPDGKEITASELRDYNNFESKVSEFEQTSQEVRERERLLAENTEIGISALNHIEQTLSGIAAQRPLNVLEQAQWQTLQQMKQYYTSTTESFKATHSRNIEANKAQQEATFRSNLDVCFAKYPDLDKDIVTIKDYLEEKGIPNARDYLNNIQMDPRIVSILQDAVATKRVKDKIISPAKRVAKKALKSEVNGVRTKQKQISMDGISSHDRVSYSQFAQLGF